ncbi:MAG: carboxylesterase/lipase family protein [Gammaproteobacteria bacterium]|nr:carboxylesterase/lipase family protein [Gammaproteobacteria bacterium]
MAIVETSCGRVEGLDHDGLSVFLGIPFAQPPVGDKRWLAPVPPEPWIGVRDAKEFGACAIQSAIPGAVGELIGIATGETSEDCLYLNVWTPSCDANKRPVMVWIHGGGNTVGSGSQPRVNGQHLAKIGDMVVVTLNYRLGALGFLHAPELGGTGNEALLDQVAGLRWVKENIEAFGGDSTNVTVFGQSAGGFDIAQLMAMPAAAGSFDQAIPMSGSLTNQVSAEAALQSAQELANRCGGFDKLRSVPADQILSLQSQIPGGRWGPVRDGNVIKEDAAEVLARGEFTRDMNLMIGHTRDESTLFTIFNREFAEMDAVQLRRLLEQAVGDRAKDALQRYESDRSEEDLSNDPIEIWSAVSTDRMFRIPAVRTADAHRQHTANVWMYRFDWESPAQEGRLHACHSLDIPFVWGTYDIERMRRFCGVGDRVAQLSDRLMQSYIAFAHTGDPNHEGIPTWPKYSETRSTMCFNADVSAVDAPMDATREFWLSDDH